MEATLWPFSKMGMPIMSYIEWSLLGGAAWPEAKLRGRDERV